ncbi:MAG: hypothetical protein U0W24_07035 [Bacteroidales bacterium]
MELDNLIYIIITVSIFIFSLLGQSKKKKLEKPVIEDGVNYSLNDFEKILQRKEEFRKQETIEIEDISEENDKIENNELIQKNHSKTEKIKEEEKESDDGFDIKSAIVYSSILERKKFRR